MFELFVVLMCLIFNAILSCVEMAFVSVSKPHLKSLALDGDILAKRVLDLKSNPERVLSVLQIGITLAGALSAAVGGASADEYLSPLIQGKFDFSEELSETLSIIAIVMPLTFFSVVVGELVPKTLALKFPMKFAKFGGTFLHILDKIFAPLVFIFEVFTKIILKIFFGRIKSDSIAEVSNSVEIDGLTDAHKQYVLNLIAVDSRKVKDIMLPWDKVITISIDSRPFEVLEVIKKSGHTRIPVLEGGEPIGVLHSKEFISQSEISKIDWLQLVRPAIFMAPEEPILNALKILQTNKNHMAVIKKKNNFPFGIVTIEDIFEEIVGEIYDEDENPRILLSSNSRIRTMGISKW